MRKADEIKRELAESQGLPEPEREAKRDMLFMEVMLDIRDTLDSVDRWVCHTETHAEEIRRACSDLTSVRGE